MTTSAPSTILGWHFAREGNLLGYGDDRAVVLGQTLTVDPARIKPCSFGLHASTSAYDALRFASGPMLWRVELGGVIVPHGDPVDKYAASERTAIAGGANAEALLRVFARQCALDVIHLWKAPDVVREYLITGKEELRAAAWEAAREAARAAARAAAWEAAREAAWEAAREAARAAARAAAWEAAREAARAAARAAAWEAAREAAREAALLRQRETFERMCLAFIETGVVPEMVVAP